ncbi:MAG TPA: RidA family protein [Longimicrobiaceae bacterium]|nr:RidA family protein [Longimicrobiaceae bacterium]
MSIQRTAAGPGLPGGFPFSLAAGTGDVCFISGMPALDAAGTFVAGTFQAEADLAWDRVKDISRAAGFAPEEIVYVQCVLGDIGDYAALNAWWRREFPDVATAPARFTFQAGALPFGAKVEFQAVAAHGR